MTTQESSSSKRPYVRPRIGRSTLRSLWYLAAVAGVLAMALLLPRSPLPLEGLDGTWSIELRGTPTGLPDGPARLLIQQGHYTLVYAAAGQPLEYGEILEEGQRVLLRPLRRLPGDEATLPTRVFVVVDGGGGLRLRAEGGGDLTGRPALDGR